MRLSRLPIVLLGTLLWSLLTLTALAQTGEAFRRGKQIFLRGTSLSGKPILAKLGQPEVEVNASAMPCASCHGPDGRGRSESGVIPANITWSALSRPLQRPDRAATRPAYTQSLFKRALVQGIDSGGQPLQASMPRFQLSLADAEDLFAYLQQMEHETDPGLSAGQVVFGVLLGIEGQVEPSRQELVEAFVRHLNEQGGIFGRKLQPRFFQLPADLGQRSQALSMFLDAEPLFALVASNLEGCEALVTRATTARQLPVIGATATDPEAELGLNRYVFYLQGGTSVLGRGLVRYLADGGLREHTAIIHGPSQAKAAQLVTDACAASGWLVTPKIFAIGHSSDLASIVQRLQDQRLDHLLYLGLDAETTETAFFQQTRKALWRPTVLVPGPLARANLLGQVAATESMLLAFSREPASLGPVVQREYKRLITGTDLPAVPNPKQQLLLSGLKLFELILTQCGRDLNRGKVLDALENTYNLTTGYGPSLSFSPNSHIGSTSLQLFQAEPSSDGPRLVPIGRAFSLQN